MTKIPDSSKWLKRVDEVEQEGERDRLRAHTLAETPPPDQAAKDITLARKSGVPRVSVETNRTLYEKRDEWDRINRATATAPGVRKWLQDGDNYAVARDSVEHMALVERLIDPKPQDRPERGPDAIDKVVGYFKDPNVAGKMIISGDRIKKNIGSYARSAVPMWQRQAQGIEVDRRSLAQETYQNATRTLAIQAGGPDAQAARREEIMQQPVFRAMFPNMQRLKASVGINEQLPEMVTPETLDTFTEAYGANSEQWKAYITAPPEEKARALGEALDATAPQSQAAIDKFVELSKEIKRLQPQTGDLVADSSLQGVASAVNMVPSILATVLLRSPTAGAAIMGGQVYFDKVGEGLTTEGVSPENARSGALQNALTEMVMERVALGYEFKLLGKPGSFTSKVGKAMIAEQAQEQPTTIIQDYIDWRILHPEMSGEDFIAQIPDHAARTFWATVVASGAMQSTMIAIDSTIAKVMPGQVREMAADAAHKNMTEIRDAIDEAPVFKRQRDAMRQFVEKATDGETVLLDDEGITQLYQDDPEGFSALMQLLEINDDQIAAAFDGRDVEIEASRLLTLEDRAQYDTLADIMRTGPDALTMAEVRAQAESDASNVDVEELQARFDEETQALEGFEKVQRSVTQQVMDAGRSPQEAEAAGAIWGAVFRRLAEAGVDEATIFEKLGLKVQGPQDAQAQQDFQTVEAEDGVLNQNKDPRIKSDVPLGTAKRGKIKLTRSLADIMAEPVPMQGIAKATGDPYTVRVVNNKEALSMAAAGKTAEEIAKKTGIHVFEYGGKRIYRSFRDAPDVTTDEIRAEFYSSLQLPRDQQPAWVRGVVDEAGPLVLKDKAPDLILDKPVKMPDDPEGLALKMSEDGASTAEIYNMTGLVMIARNGKRVVFDAGDMKPAEVVSALKEWMKRPEAERPEWVRAVDEATLPDDTGLNQSVLRPSMDDLLSNPQITAFEQEMDGIPATVGSDTTVEALASMGRTYQVNDSQVDYAAAKEHLQGVAEAYAGGDVGTDRTVTIITGPPAAGKSTIAEAYAKANRAAIIDPDDAKTIIPEYDGGIGGNAVHLESKLMADDVQEDMMVDGKNLIIPRVGAKIKQLDNLVQGFISQGYAVSIVRVEVSPDEAARRMVARFEETGRLVPTDYFKSIGDRPRLVLEQLNKENIRYAEVDYNGPKGVIDLIAGDEALAGDLYANGFRPGRGDGETGSGNVRTGDQTQEGTGGQVLGQSSDLPMDEDSRMARARAMGFDTDTVLYHGSPAIPDKFMRGDGVYGMGIYLTPSKDRAATYGPNVGSYFIRGKIAEPGFVAELANETQDRSMWAEIARERGYDGLRIGNNEILVFDPKNIRSVDAAFDPDISDSANLLDQSVDEPTLFLAHNTSAEKLRKSLELGGFPMPSLAVARTDKGGFPGYGEITLLANPKLLDESDVTAYDADIYSPRVPEQYPKVNPTKAGEFVKKAKGLIPEGAIIPEYLGYDETDRDLPRTLMHNELVQLAYLSERGKAPKLKKLKVAKEVKAALATEYDSPERDALALAYYARLDRELNAARSEQGRSPTNIHVEDDGSISYRNKSNFNDFIAEAKRSAFDQKAYKSELYNRSMGTLSGRDKFAKYTAELAGEITESYRIFKGFTYSGNRKWAPFNLENVMSEMRKDLREGNHDAFGGTGSIRARIGSAPMRKMKDVQRNRDQIISDEEMQEIKDGQASRFTQLADEIAQHYKFAATGLRYYDAAAEAIAGGPREWRESFGADALPAIRAYVEELKALPTEYFEAKANRIMQPSDFAVAVVPRNLDADVKKRLQQSGIKLIFYKSGDEADRLRVIGQNKNLLFQKKRGSVQIPGALEDLPGAQILSDQDVIVRLTQAADKTTFLHESAHIFLELYGALESENENVAKVMADIRKFLKLEPGAVLTRAQHEAFAEAFEAYLLEGKSPNAEMKSVFRSFKAWFTEVYRRLRNQLPNLNQEARDIFDRMLATDEEIAYAQGQYGAVITRAMQGIMSPEQVERYKDFARKAGDVAREKLFRKHMDKIRQRDKAAYKADLARVEGEVRADVESANVYRALADHPKLAAGTDADLLAADYGFATGDEMVAAMGAAIPVERMIKQETKRRMDDLYGDLLTDGSAEMEAVEAVFNEPGLKVMEAERDALALKAAKDPIPLAAIRARAQEMIDRMPIKDIIRPGTYALKARDLHKRSLRSAANEKWEDALRYTHQAMLQHELARRAYKAKEEISRINRYLSRFAAHRKLDPKKINPEYIGQIRTLMALPGADNQQAPMQELNDFAAREAVEGRAIVLPTDVMLAKPLDERRSMSMEQLREFRDGVKSLNAIGRQESDADREAFRAFAGGLAADIQDAWTGPKRIERRNPTFTDKVGDAARWLDSRILRWPFLIEALQGGKHGRVIDELETGIRSKLIERNSRREHLAKELAGIFKKHGISQSELMNRVTVPEIDALPIKFEQVLGAALNMGNEGNRMRISGDPSIQGDADAVLAAIDRIMDQRHWDAVQETWGLINSLWPEASAVHTRATGVSPPKVEASPVVTRHGTYAGGYYPIAYDRNRLSNEDLKRSELDDMFKDAVNSMATYSQTKQGHTIARLENVERPVDLSMGVILSHIDQVTNDIYMREEALKVSRILRNQEFRRVMAETHGREYLETLETVLKRVVVGTERTTDKVEGMFRTFRINAGVYILGYNLKVALLAPISYFQTVLPQYGVKTVLGGIMAFHGRGPAGTVRAWKAISEKSAFMRERENTLNREAHELIRKSASQSIWSKVQGAGYLPMTWLEKYTVSGPLWMGVYNDALGRGESERQAIAEADRAIATTQGSGLELDQGMWQGGNELQRTLTFMYGYVSGYYGTIRNDVSREQGLKKAIPIVKHLVIMNIVASLVEALIRDGVGDDDDPYINNVLKLMGRNVVGLVPGASSALSKYDSGPAFMQFGTKVAQSVTGWMNVAEDLFTSGEVEGEMVGRAAKSTVEAAGLGLGVPGGVQLQQIEKTLTQDDDPTLMEALITGPDSDN